MAQSLYGEKHACTHGETLSRVFCIILYQADSKECSGLSEFNKDSKKTSFGAKNYKRKNMTASKKKNFILFLANSSGERHVDKASIMFPIYNRCRNIVSNIFMQCSVAFAPLLSYTVVHLATGLQTSFFT